MDSMPRLASDPRPSGAFATPRVAVLVHNDVQRDARVIKEVRTLQATGSEVVVFGLAGKNEPARSIAVEGILQPVHLGQSRAQDRKPPVKRQIKNISSRFKFFTKVKHLVPVGVVVAGLSGLIAWFAHGTATAIWLAIVSVALIFLLLALAGRLSRRQKTKSTKRDRKPANIVQSTADLGEVGKKRHLIRSFSLGLEQLVEAHGPFDLIHCHDIIALEAGNHLARRHGWPLIWDAHELYEHLARDEPERSRANREVIEEAADKIVGMVTISDSFADYYRREHPRLPPAAVVMNATLKDEPAIDDGRLRRSAGLPAESRILIYQGGFSPFRGLPQLVEAMAHVQDPWSLVMMGWGKLQTELEELARPINQAAEARGVPPKIVFLEAAPQEELPEWTAGADLGIIAYEDICLNHHFCTPNKLWEYPNAGVPILASDLVEIRKLLTTWDTGFLMPSENDARALADRINEIDMTELQAKRRNCMEFREQHNWSCFEPALIGVYEDLRQRLAAA